MTGISAGIGLISGIDTANLIDQLIALERRPINNLQTRVSAIEVKRAAFLELSAQLFAVQNSILAFGRASFFNRFTSTSTDESVLSVTVGDRATVSSATFRVRSLVSTHSVISRGFADADTTPFGAGTLTLEVGNGKVNRSTELDMLNGGAGVGRGIITITDRSGSTAEIDLTMATTVDDVLEAVNSNVEINVRASVTSVAGNGATGDRIVLEDLSGGVGTYVILDKGNGTTATDLGIAQSVLSDRIDGRDLVLLVTSTPLALLNDGNGVGRFSTGSDLEFATPNGDFTVSLTDILTTRLDTDLRVLNSGRGVRLGQIRITDRSGATADIDLTEAQSVLDILNSINNAADVSVSATVIRVGDESFFQITDESDASDEGKLKIEDLTEFAAADLGIAEEADGSSISGSDVYRISTLGDVINLINYASGNNSAVHASISADGNGITLTALQAGEVTVTAGVDGNGVASSAASDLGLLDAVVTDGTAFESRRLVAGLNTVLLRSLNGGSGVVAGTVEFTDRAGGTTTIDFFEAQTLHDVMDLINNDPNTAFVARVNEAGNGLTLYDNSGGGNPQLTIADIDGTLAADLGIAVAENAGDPYIGNVVNGGNAQLQYVSRKTLLTDLNSGRGVRAGDFQITDSTGVTFVITLQEYFKTVGEVIDQINSATPDTIEARINDSGDGIIVTDTSAAPDSKLRLKIEDLEGGRAAAGLRLAGEARPNESFIDGAFEIRIEIGGSDSLEDVVRKINEAGGGVSASILNHGAGLNPFSLTLTSEVSGRRGELTIDALGLDLGFSTLTQAKDAIVTIGDEDASPFLISSPSNTLDSVISDVTVNLLATSDEPVTVNVVQDFEGVVEAIQSFVNSYNGVINTLDRNTSFNKETLRRGVLLGDATVSLIRSRLNSVMMRKFEGVDQSVSRLFSIGLRVGAGNRVEFDEDQFREVYESSPEIVEDLFTREDTGFGAVFKDVLEGLTRDFDGVLSRKDDLLNDQQDLLNGRIDSMALLLDAKRSRLEAQFAGLEITLAALQGQQSALSSLAQFGAF